MLFHSTHCLTALPITPRRPSPRRGVAAVEFALLAPVLGVMIIGMFELARAFMVKEMLTNAATIACRTASLPGKSNTDATTEITTTMADNSITGYTSTIQVNGVTANASTASRYDKISVKVSVPVSNVFWISTFFLTSSMIESETVSMMRQG